jgi:hypothetical protein
MSIERETFGFEVFCDGCDYHKEYDVPHDDWQGLMAAMREDGWRSRKRKEDWEHYCEGCAE